MCRITSKSSIEIKENIKYLLKLKYIDLGNNLFKNDKNLIGDKGCDALFSNFKYITNIVGISLKSMNISIYYRLRNNTRIIN